MKQKVRKEGKRNTVVLILWIVCLLGVLLTPAGWTVVLNPWGFRYFDKVAHLGLFAVTGFVAVFGAPLLRQFKSRMSFGIIVGLLLAVGTEFAQGFLSFRSRSLYDLLADIVGLGVGLALYAFLCKINSRCAKFG